MKKWPSVTTRRRARWPMALAGAALVLLTACGTTVSGAGEPVLPSEPAERGTIDPSPTPTPTPTPTPSEPVVEQPGPTFEMRMATGVATVRVDSYSWRQQGTGERSLPPEERYLVLRMTITAKEGPVSVNPLYFSVRQADGTLTEPTMGADGNEPLLGSTELQTGDSIDGIVAFDTAPQNTILVASNEMGQAVSGATIPAPQ